MKKLNCFVIAFLLFGGTAFAYANETIAPTVNGASQLEVKQSTVENQASKENLDEKRDATTTKHAKARHEKKTIKLKGQGKGIKYGHGKINKEEILHQINLESVNQASNADIENAVGKRTADRIVSVKEKQNGKFTDLENLCKEAKLGAKSLQKLAKAFPKN